MGLSKHARADKASRTVALLTERLDQSRPVGSYFAWSQAAPADQPLRSPSAVPFHCATLSAIMRVDFMAAWLSCA